ncbi:MAG: glycosyltransferase family 4 protein, partial [Chloroflexi bacterium]|nr:glycosyltransferase family 4 protein [Chloroflexota bacterium]
MRIGIDGITMSQPQPGGYRTYTTGLVEHLAALDNENEYLLFVDRPIAVQLPANWTVVVLAAKLRGVGVAWREQVTLPRAARASRIDLLHCPAGTGPVRSHARVIATIHDTIEYSEPLPPISQAHRFGMRVYNRIVQRAISHRAAHLITGSEHARQSIANRFRLSETRISVIPDAVSGIYAPMDRSEAGKRVQASHGVCDYIMAIASLAPRKNDVRLIAAYAQLPQGLRARHPLLLVCTHPPVEDHVQQTCSRAGCLNDLRTVVAPSDQEMRLLYSGATVFVFPSLDEGFGLPPLEAMACGTPVLASDASVMPEVLGDAPYYCDPTSVLSIRQGLQALLTSESLRA